jgi:hypothetical protein
MALDIPPVVYLVLIMSVPAAVGGWLAYGRGRNILLWGILCALFPAFVLMIWFQKPCKEVRGYFRRCGECGEWIKWHEEPCRYCAYRKVLAAQAAAAQQQDDSQVKQG